MDQITELVAQINGDYEPTTEPADATGAAAAAAVAGAGIKVRLARAFNTAPPLLPMASRSGHEAFPLRYRSEI